MTRHSAKVCKAYLSAEPGAKSRSLDLVPPSVIVLVTSIPACRESLRSNNYSRYFDLKYLKIWILEMKGI